MADDRPSMTSGSSGADDHGPRDVAPRRSRWLLGVGIVVVLLFVGRLAIGLVPPPVTGLRAGAELHPCPDSDNCVRSTASDPRHAIDPLACPEDRLVEVAGVALDALPRTELVELTDDYAHVIASSRWIGFIDDIELHADGEQLQVRSAARLGRGDVGVNRERVERLRAAVNETGVCD